MKIYVKIFENSLIIWLYFTMVWNVGFPLHYRHKSSMLHRALNAGGKFHPTQYGNWGLVQRVGKPRICKTNEAEEIPLIMFFFHCGLIQSTFWFQISCVLAMCNLCKLNRKVSIIREVMSVDMKAIFSCMSCTWSAESELQRRKSVDPITNVRNPFPSNPVTGLNKLCNSGRSSSCAEYSLICPAGPMSPRPL